MRVVTWLEKFFQKRQHLGHVIQGGGQVADQGESNCKGKEEQNSLWLNIDYMEGNGKR